MNNAMKFAAKRGIEILILFYIIVSVTFIVYRYMPTDHTATVITSRFSPDVKEELLELWGLDKPFLHQYAIYVKNVFSGNMGISFYYNEDVFTLIKYRFLPSLLLTGTAVTIAFIIDFCSEKKKFNTARLGIFFYVIPFVWIGLLLLAFSRGIFPEGGMRSLNFSEKSILLQIVDILYHLVLPCVVMVFWSFICCLLVETNIQGILQKKKLFPPVMMTALAAALIYYGSKVTETMFSWPGLHRTALEATLDYDYPLFLGVFITASLFCLVTSLCIEIIYYFSQKS
ncbi:MAG: ABC transporter permease [Theionarchaea archaeon]|nr:ABC transporter permease [Theionarchaea archaeon]